MNISRKTVLCNSVYLINQQDWSKELHRSLISAYSLRCKSCGGSCSTRRENTFQRHKDISCIHFKDVFLKALLHTKHELHLLHSQTCCFDSAAPVCVCVMTAAALSVIDVCVFRSSCLSCTIDTFTLTSLHINIHWSLCKTELLWECFH